MLTSTAGISRSAASNPVMRDAVLLVRPLLLSWLATDESRENWLLLVVVGMVLGKSGFSPTTVARELVDVEESVMLARSEFNALLMRTPSVLPLLFSVTLGVGGVIENIGVVCCG